MENKYDVIVIGAGHAGSEAAAAAANLGAKTLLITMDLTKIASMSCNPAVGGIAKGQIVREIDALGGYMGIVTDKSMIQFRMLNKSKGPAMWSPRAQSDRMLFSAEWRNILENTNGVDFWQDTVEHLIIENGAIKGVKTRLGVDFYALAVVLTAGTFLDGLMHIGQTKIKGGRSADQASYGIGSQLEQYGIRKGRMKTGTPVRIDGRTIDFTQLTEQKGDEDICSFSFLPDTIRLKNQRSCHIAHTSVSVHDELRTGFEFSPLFNGQIDGIGPRYCPSIEDKLVTFAEKDKHQLFLEPEGETTIEYYLNGFSSSLPLEVQFNALRKIKGLEHAKIFRPGYAIEYDFFDPTQLYRHLESKLIKGLYLAGQVNGTTGYEEAAAQGLIAGINAARISQNKEPFVLEREQAYIGVLIDDLTKKGVDEPYRMFTSRAEYRILLRQDNADERLTPLGIEIGLVDGFRKNVFLEKQKMKKQLSHEIEQYHIKPNEINDFLKSNNLSEIKHGIKLSKLLLRPQLNLHQLLNNNVVKFENTYTKDILETVELEFKYKSYIDREKETASKITKFNDLKLSPNFEYKKVLSLSIEARTKLDEAKPLSIREAKNIPGVSPNDISVLLTILKR